MLTDYPSGMLVARVGEFLYNWTLRENNNSGPPINPVNTSHDQLIIAETAVNNIHEIFNIEAPELNSSPQFVPIQAFAHGVKKKKYTGFIPII